MEKYKLTIEDDEQVHEFEVGEYLHHNGETCKIAVYKNGNLVAGFQPDRYHLLHICKNPGDLDEQLLNQIADYLETHFPFGGKHYLDETQ